MAANVLDRIEQAEALLSVGVIGRDRKEVGFLVQTAFKKYNAAKQCEQPPGELCPPPRNQPAWKDGFGFAGISVVAAIADAADSADP